MKFTDSVDEIVALVMVMGGVAVLLGGLYAICTMMCEIIIEDLILVSGTLLGPATGYLFGKSTPKGGESDIKDLLIENMKK